MAVIMPSLPSKSCVCKLYRSLKQICTTAAFLNVVYLQVSADIQTAGAQQLGEAFSKSEIQIKLMRVTRVQVVFF